MFDWPRSGLTGGISLLSVVVVEGLLVSFTPGGDDKAFRAAASQCIRPAPPGGKENRATVDE